MGYIGGLVSLGACLAYVIWAQAQGQGAAEFVPVTMLITAAIFALASLPTFLLLQRARRAAARPTPARSAWRAACGTPCAMPSACRDLQRFLVCIVFYQAGIQAVITLAAIYASRRCISTPRQTILLVLVVNVTAALGAFAFGHVQDRIGHVRAIALTLVGWIVMVLLAWAAPTTRACSGWPPTSPGCAWAPRSRRGARWSGSWRRRRSRPSSSACGGWR